MYKEEFIYDKEKGIASCILSDSKNSFIGVAYCHPEDRDMMSEKTGLAIAEARASIKMMRYEKNIVKAKMDGLKHYYYTMNNSKYFEPKSYASKRLYHEIDNLKAELQTIKICISNAELDLRNFIKEKEEFYVKLRNMRERVEN